MLANIHFIWLAEEELCAVDPFIFETQRDEYQYRILKKSPVYISPLCLEKMKTDPYLHCDKTETVWSADEVIVRGKKYPPMNYWLCPCPDNWAQLLYVNYDGVPYYAVDDVDIYEKCVIICTKEETLPLFLTL